MSTRDNPDTTGLVDGATYIEVLMLGHLCERERALHLARAFTSPLLAADAGLGDMQRLRFWGTLIAYLLGVAESSVGADGRAAIVQTMRNVPASTELAKWERLQ